MSTCGCSRQPTSTNDYCDEHRHELTVSLLTSERRLVLEGLKRLPSSKRRNALIERLEFKR
jgi:hypothetical protein